MAEIPFEGVDPIISKINKMLNDATLKVLVPMLEADIIALAPWMGLPVIKQIWQFPFEYAIARAYDGGYKWVAGKWTDVQVNGQARATEETRADLMKEMSKPEELQDESKIQAKLEEFKKRWAELSLFPGGAHA